MNLKNKENGISPPVIDTDAKIVETEIIKHKPTDTKNHYGRISVSKSFGFGFKSVLTAIIGIIISIFSFLFFGLVILLVFALPALAFILIHLFRKKR